MIPPLNLDDRSYEELVGEATRLLPSLDPDWDDYNASDPGITLIELMAWLTEMVIYRLNRVPDRSLWAFVRWLGGPDTPPLDEAIRETVTALRTPCRAVSAQDYVDLVTREFSTRVARVRCVPQRDLSRPDSASPAPGHVSLVIFPFGYTPDRRSILPMAGEGPPPREALNDEIADYLDRFRLLTTKVHVVDPRVLRVQVRATLYLRAGVAGDPEDVDALELRARTALSAYLDFSSGGPDHRGWPFDRALYRSDIYSVLHGVEGIDFAENAEIDIQSGAQAATSPVEVVEFDVISLEMATFTIFAPEGNQWIELKNQP